MTKIVILGAGSAVFAQQMVTDVLCIEGLEMGEFALVDIDPVRLELAHQLAELAVQTQTDGHHRDAADGNHQRADPAGHSARAEQLSL